jgi:hypothetical protein
MRVITFILFLFFFLLGGGYRSNANTYNSHISFNSVHNFSKNRQVKIINESNDLILIEDSDIDLEEEYVRDNDVKNANVSKFYCRNYHLLNKWYSLYYNQLLINYNLKFSKSESFLCDQSTPIYIFQGVLRI